MSSTPAAPATTTTALRDWRNWLALAIRAYLGGMLLVAGLLKVTNLKAFAFNINAYHLLPYSMTRPAAWVIAPTEVVVGLLLLLGCFTRFAAAVGALLMAMFTFGIVWVWAHGWSIDCGCFGTGGATENPQYGWEVLRDVVALLGGLWLVARPASRPSVDQWLRGPQVPTTLD